MNQTVVNRHAGWWYGSRWTVGATIGLVLLNFDHCFGTWGITDELAEILESSGSAIRHGDIWRVFTGNLVHWTAAHFYLDVGVFLLLGLMYEHALGLSFPWLVLTTGLAAGLADLTFSPAGTRCRGLSGVDSGLFAAALVVECRLALKDPFRWLWAGPATAIFFLKNAYEVATGESFFSTEHILGPAKLAVAAHVAAILAALVFCTLMTWTQNRRLNV